MICVRCENQEFALKPEAELEQEFRGEALKVVAPAMACTRCGWVTLAPGQLDALRKRTADVYRERHMLLTSAEIKACRETLGMSQREFANFLKVGEASVKRWETWQVQDQSSDELIRLKCQLAKVLTLSGATWKTEWRTSDLVRVFVSHSAGKQETVRLLFDQLWHADVGLRVRPDFVGLIAHHGTWAASDAVGFAKWWAGKLQSARVRRLASEEHQEWRALLDLSASPKRREQPAKRKNERNGADYDPALALAA